MGTDKVITFVMIKRLKYKNALRHVRPTSIAVLLDFVWCADVATWCIGNREMESPARVNLYLWGGALCTGRVFPTYTR